jgi:hypothetical protein
MRLFGFRSARQTRPGDGESSAVRDLIPALTIFALALPIFLRLSGDTRDYLAHIKLAMEMDHGGERPPHPLFHWTLRALAAGTDIEATQAATALLLAAAISVRAWLTAGALASSHPLRLWSLTLLCLALALAMPLPNWWNFPNIYLGQASPNIWHNPTAIFAMPFVLALYLLGVRALDELSWGLFAAVGVTMALCLLAKPNYCLGFAPCFFVMALASLVSAARSGRFTADGAAARMLLAFVPASAVILWQSFVVFPDYSGGTRLIYAPFVVWGGMVPNINIPAAVFLGVAFPVAACLSSPAAAVRDRGLVLSWATMALCVVQFALLAETGNRFRDGNLGWGMILSAHVLFVASCVFLLRQPASVRRGLAFGVFGLQVVSGCVFLVRTYMDPSKFF